MASQRPYAQLSVTGFPGAAQTAVWLYAPAVLRVAFAMAAMALSAQVAIPVPWSPVPLTLQSLAVLLTGFALGAKLAPVAVIAYLSVGAAGWPVFASGSAGLAGPTGGYLVGFILAAAFVGYVGQGGGWVRSTLAALGGSLLIFLCGVPWLAATMRLSADQAVGLGLLPFLPDAALKLAVAVTAVQAFRHARRPKTRKWKLETRN